MKQLFLILFTFLGSAFNLSAQLVADAGNDFLVCQIDTATSLGNYQLGGTPAATGGVEPYTYKWYGTYSLEFSSIVVNASFFLNDTTIANPSLIASANNNSSLLLFLEVTDSENNIALDSIEITFSQFANDLFDYYYFTEPDDTIQIATTHVGGIPPLSFEWSPNYNIWPIDSPTPLVSPDTSTNYICTITDAAGCQTDTGDIVEVYVSTTNIENISDQLIDFHYSPASQSIVIENNEKNIGEFSYQIIDLNGRSVLSNQTLLNEHTEIDVRHLPNGVYNLVVESAKGEKQTFRFVKL